MSRKRDRVSADAAEESPPRSPVASLSPSSEDTTAAGNFGGFLWNDVSILLFYRIMYEAHSTCLELAKASAASRGELLCTFTSSMHVIWAVAQHHLTKEEVAEAEPRYSAFATTFVSALRTCVEASAADRVALCRQLLRFCEESGFPEMEFGPLASLLAELVMKEDVQGYAYCARTTPVLAAPPRHENDKRSDEEHRRKRVGFDVVLPDPHPNPNATTHILLSEPRRRKPVLDDYRISSHPKKAAAFAADDFMVDDELLHRAYVMLSTHLDSYGSLTNLSPYARLLLWNLLERNDALFTSLYDQRCTTEVGRQQLLRVRELVAGHKLAFEETRPAARRAAGVLSWYAISAQWRDQALQKLEELEEADWYLLADAYKSGGTALFPNYARNEDMVHLVMGVLRKLDRLHQAELEDVPPPHRVAEALLLPLLQGETPTIAGLWTQPGPTDVNAGHRRRRKLRGIMEEAVHKVQQRQTETPSSSSRSHIHVFLCPSLIFPLQCMGELLELCSLVVFAHAGFDAFTRSFLATSWEEEDTILAYLLRREPTNPSLVPLVGIPRLYRDLVTGIQLLMADKMLPHVVDCCVLASDHPRVSLQERSYPYWKALATMLLEEDRFDDLCLLRVSRRADTSCLYTMGTLEKAPRVWPEDLYELHEEESAYRKSGGEEKTMKEEEESSSS